MTPEKNCLVLGQLLLEGEVGKGSGTGVNWN